MVSANQGPIYLGRYLLNILPREFGPALHCNNAMLHYNNAMEHCIVFRQSISLGKRSMIGYPPTLIPDSLAPGSANHHRCEKLSKNHTKNFTIPCVKQFKVTMQYNNAI